LDDLTQQLETLRSQQQAKGSQLKPSKPSPPQAGGADAPPVVSGSGGGKGAPGVDGNPAATAAAAAPEPALPSGGAAGGASEAAVPASGQDDASWQAYVESYLLADLAPGVPRLRHAAIVGTGSGVWGSDAAFPAISPAEAAAIEALFARGAPAAAAAASSKGGGGGESGGGHGTSGAERFTIAGKAYEVVSRGGDGTLLCRAKGGFMGMGAAGGVAARGTGRGVLVLGAWERSASAGEESVYVEAVSRLTDALVAYGY
jgi:hypothetical protein